MQNNFLLNGIFNVVALIGFFALFCYIFDLLSKKGFKYGYEGEEKRIFSPVYYFLIVSTLLTGGIIASYFEGILGPFTISRDIEVFYLLLTLTILLASSYILKTIYPKTFNDYKKLIIFLNKTFIFKNFNQTSIMIFFLTVITPFFGYILGFNIISIICLDLMMMFIVGILGSINNIPTGLTNIKLNSSNEISNVFILSWDQDFVSYLSEDDKVRKIAISAIESHYDESFSPNISNLIQTVSNIHISNFQDQEIKNNCISLIKINDSLIFQACIVSIICGVFLNPIVSNYITLGLNTTSFLMNFIIIFIFITTPIAWLIRNFFKTIS